MHRILCSSVARPHHEIPTVSLPYLNFVSR
jgi:hypothetical protein